MVSSNVEADGDSAADVDNDTCKVSENEEEGGGTKCCGLQIDDRAQCGNTKVVPIADGRRESETGSYEFRNLVLNVEEDNSFKPLVLSTPRNRRAVDKQSENGA